VKRILALVLLLTFVFAVGILPTAAQTAPVGEWRGSWPYVLPPDHTLNAFASNGLDDNLGTVYRPFVQLPFAILKWADNTYEGLLADKWGFSADNKSYQVHIKDGAKWSDGKPITADDVINTFVVSHISAYSSVWSYISDVQKVDDQTVNFIFSGEASPLAENLILKSFVVDSQTYGDLAKRGSDLIAAGKTSDSDEWKALAADIAAFKPASLISSGPYTYALSDVGTASLILHWQPNSIYSSTVKFGDIKLWQGDTDLTTPLVLSGEEAHSTDVYPTAVIDQLKSQGVRLITVPRGYGPALLFNHDVHPWDVKEVRQAAALVINREQNAFLTGAGSVPTVYMSGILDDNVPTLLPADVIAKLDHYDFDVDRAGKLLESVGYTKNADGKWADKDGKTIAAEFKFPAEFADFSGAAQDAAAQLNAAGFDITLRSLPWQQTSAAIQSGDFQMSVWSWASQSPFASRQFFGPTQRFNNGHLAGGKKGMDFPYQFEWNGQQIDLDKMITDASSSLDDSVRMQRAGQVALIINDELPFIPLNIEQSVEPFNEKYISGAPADDDPILKNPSGSDHWIIPWLLEGKLSPTADATPST